MIRIAILACLFSFSLGAAAASASDDTVRLTGGTFTMGSARGLMDERPPHSVTLKAFLIDRRPVTNAELAEFLGKLGAPRTRAASIYLIRRRRCAHPQSAGALARRSRASKIIRPTRPAGTARATIVPRSASGCRARPSANSPRAVRRGAAIPGARPRPTQAARATASAGPRPCRAAFSRKVQRPKACSISPAMCMNGPPSIMRPYPYRADDGREEGDAPADRVVRGGAADTGPDSLRASWRGANVSRGARAGHHNIGFRCVKDAE